MRLVWRRAENGKGKRTFKRQVSKGELFKREPVTTCEIRIREKDTTSPSFNTAEKLSLLGQCHRKSLFSLSGGKNPHPLSFHINAFTRLQKINRVFMQCSICWCASLGKSTFLLLLQSFILIL